MGPNGKYGLPDGWEWAEPTWHPLSDPIWKSHRMAKHSDGRLANFESRSDLSHADRRADG